MSNQFANILRRLGERGEKGESPRYQREEARANGGRIGANSLGEKANPDTEGEYSPQFAPHSPRCEPAAVAAIRPIRPIRPEPEENVNLSKDFKLVATWWSWSPDDTETFKAWAKQNRDEAAAWVHQEAAVVRDYQDRLHVSSITELIRP